MSLSLYQRQRRAYVLGHGSFSGYVTLDNGRQVWLEYQDELVRRLTSLNDVRDALEYIAAKFCEQTAYNHIQIRFVSAGISILGWLFSTW